MLLYPSLFIHFPEETIVISFKPVLFSKLLDGSANSITSFPYVIVAANNSMVFDKRIPLFQILHSLIIGMGSVDVDHMRINVQSTSSLFTGHPNRNDFVSQFLMDDIR
jgi:hypothetical protein